jgi:hypothetical protein
MENDVLQSICQYLWYRKIYFWRNNNTPTFDRKRGIYRSMPKWAIKGVSDILGILPDGRFLAIEVKQPGKYATKEQKAFLAQINAFGGMGFVARSIDDVQKFIK